MFRIVLILGVIFTIVASEPLNNKPVVDKIKKEGRPWHWDSHEDFLVRPKCQANETFTDCASSCGDSCEKYTFGLACIEQCRDGWHCACKPGYYRDPRRQCCVLACDCPHESEYESSSSEEHETTTKKHHHHHTRPSKTRSTKPPPTTSTPEPTTSTSEPETTSTTTKEETTSTTEEETTTTTKEETTSTSEESTTTCEETTTSTTEPPTEPPTTTTPKPTKKTRPTCAPHEVWKPSNPCLDSCSHHPCKCPTEVTEKKCYCKKGFCRNENGICMPRPGPSTCPERCNKEKPTYVSYKRAENPDYGGKVYVLYPHDTPPCPSICLSDAPIPSGGPAVNPGILIG